MLAALATSPVLPKTGVLVRPLSHYKTEAVEWLWPDRIPRGELTILAGDGGLGKSTLAALLAAQVSTGRLRGANGTGNVLVLLGEDAPQSVLKPRLKAAGADPEKIHVVVSSDGIGDDLLTLPDDHDRLRRHVMSLKADLLIVDPLTAYLGGSVDSHRDGGKGGLRAVLGPLARLAHETGVTVVVAAHLNKGSGPSSQRIGGSAGVRNAARNVLMLAPHPEARDDGADDGRRILGHEKSNLGKLAPSLDLTVLAAPAVADSGLPLLQQDGTPVTTSLVVVGGDSAVDYRDALTAATAIPSDEPSGGLADAERFLRDALAAGPVPSKTIKGDSLEFGISDVTLRRARASLGVVAVKEGAIWVLTLPPEEGAHDGGNQGAHSRVGLSALSAFPKTPPKTPTTTGDNQGAHKALTGERQRDQGAQGAQGAHPTRTERLDGFLTTPALAPPSYYEAEADA